MRYGLVASNIGSFSKPGERRAAGGAGRGGRLGGAAALGSPRVGLGRAGRRSVGHARRRRRAHGAPRCSAPASRRFRAAARRCSRSRWRRSTSCRAAEPSSAQGSAATARSSRSSARASTPSAAGRCSRTGSRSIRELWAGPLGPREIPIWIGGNSPRARRLAAAYDGWLPDSTSLDEMTHDA